MWYGRNQVSNFKKSFYRQQLQLTSKLHRYNLNSNRSLSLYSPTSSLYIPSQWSVAILTALRGTKKINVLYLTSAVYTFRLVLPAHPSSFYFDRQTRSLILNHWCRSNFFPLYFNSLTNFFYSLNIVYFRKLKFKGKGYYIYKGSRNTLTTQFGHSHRIYLYTHFLSVKFLSKVSILFFGFSKKDLFQTSVAVYATRPINIFTGRGVRFAQQILYRKTGKVSTHR